MGFDQNFILCLSWYSISLSSLIMTLLAFTKGEDLIIPQYIIAELVPFICLRWKHFWVSEYTADFSQLVAFMRSCEVRRMA